MKFEANDSNASIDRKVFFSLDENFFRKKIFWNLFYHLFNHVTKWQGVKLMKPKNLSSNLSWILHFFADFNLKIA